MILWTSLLPLPSQQHNGQDLPLGQCEHWSFLHLGQWLVISLLFRMRQDYINPWMEFCLFKHSVTWSQKFFHSFTHFISFSLLMDSGCLLWSSHILILLVTQSIVIKHQSLQAQIKFFKVYLIMWVFEVSRVALWYWDFHMDVIHGNQVV